MKDPVSGGALTGNSGSPGESHQKRSQLMGKKVKGLISTNCQLEKQSWDVEHSTGNTVNNTVITMYRVRWVLGLPGRTLCKVYECLVTMLYT